MLLACLALAFAIAASLHFTMSAVVQDEWDDVVGGSIFTIIFVTILSILLQL